MTKNIQRREIQFAGYAPEPLLLPLMSSPFSSADNASMLAAEAEAIIESTLMSR